MTILANPVFHRRPWPYFTCDPAFSEAQITHFQTLFDQASSWEQHNSALYDGAMSDASAHVDPQLKIELIARVADLTGLPLTDRLQVNVQRMAPGQDVRPHSDQPLVGYEIARIVLQLNGDWNAEDGGLLQVHPDAEGRVVCGQVAPERNTALGFVLHTGCHHSVTQVHRPRNSVVLYFWHQANTPALAAHLGDLCRAMDFGALPDALDPLMEAAESTLDEAHSYRAAIVGWVLHQWGCTSEVVVRGYLDEAYPTEASTLRLWDAPGSPQPEKSRSAIALARWAAMLRTQHFDLDRWGRLRDTLSPPKMKGARAFWDLAFPSLRLRPHRHRLRATK